jgi:cation transport ATPase
MTTIKDPQHNRPTEAIPSTLTNPALEKWNEHMQQEQKETPKRLEEAAKTLTGIISIALAIFLSVGNNSFENGPGPAVQAALVLWLVSLLAAFAVVFPFPYKYKGGNTQSFKDKHKTIVNIKYTLLVVSSLFFVSALALLTVEFFFCG